MTDDQGSTSRTATAAYTSWVAAGRPWLFSRPVRALAERLRAHGYVVYLEGDERHLTKATPEDHTPFSVTGWPVKSPYPYCNAADIMPPTDGQVSRLTGRRLPSLQQLAAQLRADRITGRPEVAWLKYMNFEPEGDNVGPCYQDSWKPDYARRDSTDRGHIHISGRSDMVTATMGDGYDLVARTEQNMTIYGWDASHYDAVPSGAKVVSEGFAFMTHKAGGDANDAELAAWWSAMKPCRDRLLLGAYWVLYPGNPAGRAGLFTARLDSQCPGWRDGPFILQVDCEIWGGDRSTMPGRADIKAFCDRLRVIAPKLLPIVYAPKWAYADSLAGLGYPLWASSYVTGSGAASSLYPGDTSTRWGAYSGQIPAVLQFTSSATITGQTTCDANAFRGSLAQLTNLLAPGWTAPTPPKPVIPATEEDDMPTAAEIAKAVWDYRLDVDVSAAGVNNQPAGGIQRYGSYEHHRIMELVLAAQSSINAVAGAVGKILANVQGDDAGQLELMAAVRASQEALEALVAGQSGPEPLAHTAAHLAPEDVPDDDADRAAREGVQPRIEGSGE